MEKKYEIEEIRSRWDEVASRYAAITSEYGDINREAVLTPVVLETLGDVKGKRILDAGCGEGFLSRLMAEGGASVVAVDLSEKLLDFARERTDDRLPIEYRRVNFEDLSRFPDGSFDVVVSMVAIQDTPDHEKAIREAYRVLVPSGFYLLALLHPCFSSEGRWVRDEEGKKLHWKIDNYFLEGPTEEVLFPEARRNPIQFKRTLTTYFRAILEAGFRVDRLVEPSPSPEAIEKFPGFKDDLRMSHFIVLKLKKGRRSDTDGRGDRGASC